MCLWAIRIKNLTSAESRVCMTVAIQVLGQPAMANGFHISDYATRQELSHRSLNPLRKLNSSSSPGNKIADSTILLFGRGSGGNELHVFQWRGISSVSFYNEEVWNAVRDLFPIHSIHDHWFRGRIEIRGQDCYDLVQAKV